MRGARLLLPLLLGGAIAAPARAQDPAEPPIDGGALYRRHCASCHDTEQEGTRGRSALEAMPADHIVIALTKGLMAPQGKDLKEAERQAIAAFLSRVDPRQAPERVPATCRSTAPFAADAEPLWNGWGTGLENSRFQTGPRAGLDAAAIPRLQLRWAQRFPGARAVAQPIVVGGRLFLGSDSGTVYSLDRASGCVYWSYQAKAPVRGAPSLGRIGVDGSTRPVIVFGDQSANVYALDARSGEPLWVTEIDDTPGAKITGSPALHGNRVFVPVSSNEERLATNPRYECCRFRGSVVALHLASGRRRWRTFTIPEKPRPLGKSRVGTQRWGPSGAAIWSAPTLDVERNVLYVVTGNNYSQPATKTSDALLAIDPDDGKVLWSRQFTSGDVHNGACRSKQSGENCPGPNGTDSDFAASPVLRSLPNGRRALVLLQKSGAVFAIDPDSRRLLWEKRASAAPFARWGLASDAAQVYVPLLDWPGWNPKFLTGGTLALRLEDGEEVWRQEGPEDAFCPSPRCAGGFAAAITAIPDAVITGSLKGNLWALSSVDGRILWEFDTTRPVVTVNGDTASGGAINGPGPVIADGMVFAQSGDGAVPNGVPGNMIFAFSVPGPGDSAGAR